MFFEEEEVEERGRGCWRGEVAKAQGRGTEREGEFKRGCTGKDVIRRGGVG